MKRKNNNYPKYSYKDAMKIVNDMILSLFEFINTEDFKKKEENYLNFLCDGVIEEIHEQLPDQVTEEGNTIGIYIVPGARERIKSRNSIVGKVKKMELERLAKLYSIQQYQFDDKRIIGKSEKSVASKLLSLLSIESYDKLKEDIENMTLGQIVRNMNKYNISTNAGTMTLGEQQQKLKESILIDRAKMDYRDDQEGKVQFTDEDRDRFFYLIAERVGDNKELVDRIREIVYYDINSLSSYPKLREKVKEYIKEDSVKDLSKVQMDSIIANIFVNEALLLRENQEIDYTAKLALFRYLKAKVHGSELPNKEELLKSIYEKVGEGTNRANGFEREDNAFNSLNYVRLTDDDVLKLKIGDVEMEELLNTYEFLRPKDLIGGKVVLSNIPEGYQLPRLGNIEDEATLDEIETERRNAYDSKIEEDTGEGRGKKYYETLATFGLCKLLGKSLYHNTKLLAKYGFYRFNNKVKNKIGYMANHTKIMDDSMKYETQYVPYDVERRGRENHKKMPGKEELILDPDDPDLIYKIKFTVCQYNAIVGDKKKNRKYKKCDLLVNLLEYGYRCEDDEDNKKYKRVFEIVDQYVKDCEKKKQNSNEWTKEDEQKAVDYVLAQGSQFGEDYFKMQKEDEEEEQEEQEEQTI